MFYFIPEDNDSPKQLNCFLIHKQIDKVSLEDIRRHFPVPGSYFFRFQYIHQKNLIWMDFTNESCKLPRCEGVITIKATRLSWTAKPREFEQDIGTYFQEQFLLQEEAALHQK